MANIDIVRNIIELTESSEEQIVYVADRPGHDRRYAMGYEKANKVLGWSPETDWKSGISSTVNWYIQNSEWVESTMSGEYLEWIKSHYGG